MKKQWLMKTSLVPLYLVASEKGLCGIFWKRQEAPFAASLDGADPCSRWLATTVRQLGEYFEGSRREFDLTFDIGGTDFQRAVWKELSRIPYGETRSYSDIARRLRNEKAVRAVGTANGRNPLSIVVPCHRVIAANGTLGGYAGGLDVKRRLLGLERGE